MDILRSHSARRRRFNQMRINLFTGFWLSALYAMLVFGTVSFGCLLLRPSLLDEVQAEAKASAPAPSIERQQQKEDEREIEDCIHGLLPSYPCKQLVNP